MRLRIVGIGGKVSDPFGKIPPALGSKVARIFRMRCGFFQRAAKLLVGERLPADAHDVEVRRHASHASEIVERWNQLASGEVPGRAKDHQDARVCLRQGRSCISYGRARFNDRSHVYFLSFMNSFMI